VKGASKEDLKRQQ